MQNLTRGDITIESVEVSDSRGTDELDDFSTFEIQALPEKETIAFHADTSNVFEFNPATGEQESGEGSVEVLDDGRVVIEWETHIGGGAEYRAVLSVGLDEPAEDHEIVTDGGEDVTEHVSDEQIEDAIAQHDDPGHEDALTVADVRELLAWLQRGIEANWATWMDNIEDGYSEVIHEDNDIIVLSTGQHDSVSEELDHYEGDVTIDKIAKSVVSNIHHAVARERCDWNWSTSHPLVIRKHDGVNDGQQYVEAFINGLLAEGLSPAEAWAFYGVEIRGNSQSSWARRAGKDQSTINRSLTRAKEKLSGR